MKKIKRVIAMILVLTLLITNFGGYSVNAEINKKYGDSETAPTIDTSESSDNNSLLGLLATCIITIARLVEGVVTSMVRFLTQDSNATFPWVDLIIFNTIPILDINIINPASGSLLDISEGKTIGPVIRNIYFTGLSIAIGFLGIVVGVMVIRMALSTIAATKARYKESIVTLLTTLVLLFGAHFMLSFMFYMNEKMVEVASDIVQDIAGSQKFNVGGDQSSDGSTKSQSVVSSLGEWFFEDATSEHKENGNLITKLSNLTSTKPIPAVLYAMFIVQSIMFLFSYFKRFFYVVILSVIAPFVIIYDFLGKSISE